MSGFWSKGGGMQAIRTAVQELLTVFLGMLAAVLAPSLEPRGKPQPVGLVLYAISIVYSATKIIT